MIRILHIALHDRKTGEGAGAALLHDALLKLGAMSELWVFEHSMHNSSPRVYQLGKGQLQKPYHFTREMLEQVLHGRAAESFDFIHLHGLGQVVPADLLLSLQGKRLLWSIEDCSPYTAGCGHSAHCGQWAADGTGAECSSCPLCGQDKKRSQLQQQSWQHKQVVYSKLNLELLCQNSWQQEQLGRSMLKSAAVRVCSEPINEECFYPAERYTARENLGLPHNAFVLVLPTNFSDGRERVLNYVRSVLQGMRNRYMGYLVLVHVGTEPLPGHWAVDEVRTVLPGLSVLAEYYRAANLQLYFSGIDTSYRQVREAAQCALPSAVLRLGAAETVVPEGQGKVLTPFDESELTELLLAGLQDGSELIQQGMKAYVEQRKPAALADSLAVYGFLPAGKAMNTADYAAIIQSGREACQAFLEKSVERWQTSDDDKPVVQHKKQQEKMIFVDRFCRDWLAYIDPENKTAVWDLVEVWDKVTPMQISKKYTSPDAVQAELRFCHELRSFLVQYFQHTSLTEFSQLPRAYTAIITKLWYFVFLNTESVLNRAQEKFECPQKLLQQEGKSGYPLFFLWSMFVPYVPKKLDIHVDTVMLADLPASLRVVVACWLVTAPFFGGTQEQRAVILHHLEEICAFMRKKPDFVSEGLRFMLMDKIMVSLWRLSYLGGNNIRAIRAYGDFLQSLVARQYKEFAKPIRPRHRKADEPLRIGYVSTNFRDQAVTRYMANRIKYHDRDKFFVKSFILLPGKGDSFTQDIRDWSDDYEDIETTGLGAGAAIASAIKRSQLDLLIYADIGMNNMTYILGAMHLAPVQAVLVGHGTTTGLSSLDYYISGDHEPENAQEHYVEKIVKLPNAGAAQLPPAQSKNKLSRSMYEIPEDAVLFISCANGLKHIEARDQVLIDILRKAPNAYILLKPYLSPDTVDWKFKKRVMAAAEKAGVADRLKIIPPLTYSGDLMALLQLADVQLDTYPYGGWTTNLEAIYYHLPLVTQQGDIARSRWGAGLLQAMGIQEGIARNAKEYVDWAVRFAKEPELRQTTAQRIAEMAPKVLFNGETAQPGYEKALLQMVKEKEKSFKHK